MVVRTDFGGGQAGRGSRKLVTRSTNIVDSDIICHCFMLAQQKVAHSKYMSKAVDKDDPMG